MNGGKYLNSVEMTIVRDAETIGGIWVTSVGENLYRVEVDPICGVFLDRLRDLRHLPRYGDIVEAQKTGPDTTLEPATARTA